MAKKKHVRRRPAKPSANKVSAKLADDGGWQLVHPRCAHDRREDLEEVEQMIEAGELDIARDELLYLLNDCHGCLAAHALLGQLAVRDGDFRLARGHFGYAYQIAIKAIDRAPPGEQFPYRLPNNRAFYLAGQGLVYCLLQLGKRGTASDVAKRLLKLDPTDSLGIRDILSGKTACSSTTTQDALPIVELDLTKRPTNPDSERDSTD